jgi:hypothetical protein
MKSKKVIVVAAIVMITIGIITFILLGSSSPNLNPNNSDTKNPSMDLPSNDLNQPSDPSGANDLAFRVLDDKLSIDNNSGQEILIEDFRDDADVYKNDSFPESYSIEPQEYSNQFSIFFYGDSGNFQSTIITTDVQEALLNLQTYLANKLSISAAETCFLRGSITVPEFVGLPSDQAGQIYKLPGC